MRTDEQIIAQVGEDAFKTFQHLDDIFVTHAGSPGCGAAQAAMRRFLATGEPPRRRTDAEILRMIGAGGPCGDECARD